MKTNLILMIIIIFLIMLVTILTFNNVNLRNNIEKYQDKERDMFIENVTISRENDNLRKNCQLDYEYILQEM